MSNIVAEPIQSESQQQLTEGQNRRKERHNQGKYGEPRQGSGVNE